MYSLAEIKQHVPSFPGNAGFSALCTQELKAIRNAQKDMVCQLEHIRLYLDV
jgi:hypothetical protein